tara:strand:- start:5459 stop:5716 length:258 start_codon:yes stop_codon:yes gene_type:complete
MVSRNEVFTFLEQLRASGKVNMFESPKHLENKFGMTPEEAKMDFFQWTQHLKREEDATSKEIDTNIAQGWGTKEEDAKDQEASNS